MKEELD